MHTLNTLRQGVVMAHIGIIGAGAHGIALACVMRRGGNDVVMWARESEVAAAINRAAESPQFLKGVKLPPVVRASGDLALAATADILLLASPAQHMRAVTRQFRPHVAACTPIVTCANLALDEQLARTIGTPRFRTY